MAPDPSAGSGRAEVVTSRRASPPNARCHGRRHGRCRPSPAPAVPTPRPRPPGRARSTSCDRYFPTGLQSGRVPARPMKVRVRRTKVRVRRRKPLNSGFPEGVWLPNRMEGASAAHPPDMRRRPGRSRRWRDHDEACRCWCCLTGDGADGSETGWTPTGGTWKHPPDTGWDKYTNPVVVRIQSCKRTLVKLEPEVIARPEQR